MIAGLLKASGFLILKLIYGKDSKKLEEFGLGTPMMLSVCLMFWLMSLLLLFTGAATKETWLHIVFGIGYPLVLFVWGMIVRAKKKK